jgi:hypothetical protein
VANLLLGGTFHEAENLGCEEVGPCVHRHLPLPGHDDGARVR